MLKDENQKKKNCPENFNPFVMFMRKNLIEAADNDDDDE